MTGVYLVYHNRLFRDAVCAILATHPEIKLLGVTDQPGIAAAEIASHAPTVVLLEDAESDPTLHNLSQMLSDPFPCRMISLRMNENSMRVWSHTWRQTVQPDDLVNAILAAREDEA